MKRIGYSIQDTQKDKTKHKPSVRFPMNRRSSPVMPWDCLLSKFDTICMRASSLGNGMYSRLTSRRRAASSSSCGLRKIWMNTGYTPSSSMEVESFAWLFSFDKKTFANLLEFWINIKLLPANVSAPELFYSEL